MANNNADIELLAGLSIDSSEAEILKAIKIIEKRLKANSNARIKLNADIDETVIRNTVEKLQNILKGKELKIETKSSIEAITKEVDAMADIVTVAKKAANEKLEFAKANERVRNSADDTTDAVNRERDAMESLDDVESILNGINIHGQYGTSVFQRFGTTFRDAFSAYSLANLMERALDGVINAGKEAIETVKELNKESTSLIMATGAERSVVEQYMSDYNTLGQELGFITSDISQAASDYLRQGLSIADTNELIRDSLMLAKVSELETADSTAYLTAIMNAYKLKANEVIETVDRLAAVDLNAAVDAGGIAQAMSKTAVSAQLAGVSIDQLIAMVTTVGEVSQAGMSEVGNSIRTIFARMKDVADGNLSRIGDDGTIENLSNIEGTLGAIGIQLRASNNEFRNMFTVLDETADKWVDMSSVQKAAVAEAYSGIRQSEKFNILMENWDKVRKYIEVSEQSSGVATEKFDAYLDSIEAKTNSLKASLENLATTTISDELLISILEVGKEIVDLTADTGVLKSALIGLGTGATAYTFTHLARFMNESAQGLSNFSTALNLVNNGITANDMQALVDLSHGLSNSQMRLLLSTNNLTNAQKIALMVANGTERELAEQQLQTWGLINAQNNATASTVTLGSAMRGLAASMIANPIFAVTTAVTLGITAFNLYQSSVEKAEQKLKDLQTTLNETTTELEGVQSEIDNINKQIDDLLAKDTLSITDENDLKRLREENEELRARKILLDAQREEDAKAVNKEVEHRYEKDFLAGANYHFNSDSGVGEYHNNIDYLDIQIDRANELLALNRNLTEEEKEEFGAIKSYITEQSNALVELADSYEPITEEQKALKEGWEELIAKSSEVVGTYAGTIPDITDRLVEKFATGKGTQEVDNAIKEWLDSLSDENKKVMIGCELDNATLEELKAYLKEQTADIETSGVADVEVKLSFDYGTLGEISQKLANVESAYKLVSEARDAYNEQGYYSMDAIDSILALEDEYINILVDENGQLQINSDSMNKLAGIKIETAKASIYQETCEELVRIKTLDTALAAQELALINGTLTESAYETAKALYEEVQAMGGTNAVLAGEVWNTASKKVKLLDNQLKNLNNGSYDVDKSALADSLTKAREEAEKATKKYIESYMDLQKKSLEKGAIDYNTYCDTVSNLLKSMYKEGKLSAQDYHTYTKQMLESQLNIYDRAISGIAYIIDKEVESLEKQKESIESTYKTKIDTIQSEIDLRKKAYEQRKEEDELNDAIYNKERARNQKTNLQFVNGQMVYTPDGTAIKDAEEVLADKKHEMEVSRLESQIESLEKAMESEIETIDKEIKKYEEYKKQIQDVAKEYENAENVKYALAVTGLNSEAEILECRIDVLNTFRDNYLKIQQSIVDAAWNSANEQNKALASVGNGSTNGSGDLGNGDDVVIEVKKNPPKGSANIQQNSRDVLMYHDGINKGYVGEGISKDKKLSLLKSIANGTAKLNLDEVPAILKKREVVLTEAQQSNIIKYIAQNPIMPNVSMPKYDYTKLGNNRGQTIEQHNQFNVTLPNITDNSKAIQLFTELQRLPLDAQQHANKTR